MWLPLNGSAGSLTVWLTDCFFTLVSSFKQQPDWKLSKWKCFFPALIIPLVTFIPIFRALSAVPWLCLNIKRLTLFGSSNRLCGHCLYVFDWCATTDRDSLKLSHHAKFTLMLFSSDNAFSLLEGVFSKAQVPAATHLGCYRGHWVL